MISYNIEISTVEVPITRELRGSQGNHVESSKEGITRIIRTFITICIILILNTNVTILFSFETCFLFCPSACIMQNRIAFGQLI